MDIETVDLVSSEDEDVISNQENMGFLRNTTAENTPSTFYGPVLRNLTKSKNIKETSIQDDNMTTCRFWSQFKITKDIDSYVAVCQSLEPFIPSFKFTLNLNIHQLNPCLNTKITDRYIKNNAVLIKPKETGRILKFYDIKLGGAFPLNIYCLFVIHERRNAELRHSVAQHFLDNVVKTSLLALSPDTVTRKNCGGIFAPTSEKPVVSIFQEDWNKFSTNVQNNLQSIIDGQEVIDLLFYQANHGLKCKDKILVNSFISNSIQLHHKDILFFQLHPAVTLEAKDSNMGIIAKIDVMKKVLERESDESKRPVVHEKYFLSGFGHLSNAAHPYKLDNIDYVQIYDTSSHLIYDHANRNNVFPFIIAGGFTSDYKGFRDFSDASHCRLKTYFEYVKSVSSHHDLRIEVVITTDNPLALIEDFFGGNLANFIFLNQRQESTLPRHTCYYFFKLLQELLNFQGIVLINSWEDYCKQTINPLLYELKKMFDNVKISTDYFDRKLYLLAHATETLIMYWIEGNDSRVNGKMLNHILVRYDKFNAESLKKIIKKTNDEGLLGVADIKVGSTLEPRNNRLHNLLYFMFHVSNDEDISSYRDDIKKLVRLLMKRVAQGYSFISNNYVIDERLENTNEVQSYRRQIPVKNLYSVVILQSEVVCAIQKPNHPLLALLNSWIMRQLSENDKIEFFKSLLEFVQDNVLFFPRIFLTNENNDKNYWANVVKDPASVPIFRGRLHGLHVSGKIVKMSNLKQYKAKARDCLAIEVAKDKLNDVRMELEKCHEKK